MSPPNRHPLDLLEPGALLNGPLLRSLASSVDRSERLAEGTRLGSFRVEGEIGAGGMGVVYRAQRDDGAFRQAVAIKCLGRRSDERSHELFLRERQILAELRHPHIARLVDGGRHEDARLWFAMELVEGERIDAHVATRRLDVEARLRALVEVVDAVAFAHARLLIHRDIKPANVLVDGDGRAKLLDFGIAALAGDEAAVRAYSPAWASPEQLAGGDVGPASDQYQLGLLLDALLRAPVQGVAATALESTRTLPSADGVPMPATASRPDPDHWMPLRAARRAELAAIAARATRADPAARYGSVNELGDELQRWLARRPVLAVGGGIGYAARCAVQRHPWIAAAAGAGFALLVALVAGFSLRLAQERDLAQAAAARAEREAATAQAINQFLREDLIRAADPYGENARDAPISELIEKAIPRVEQRLAGQPAIAGELYAALGATLLNLGRPEPAGLATDLAIERLGEAWGADSEQVIRQRIYRADVDEAAAQYDILRARLDTLKSDLAARGPRDPLVIEVDRYQAWTDYITGEFDDAVRGFAETRLRAEGVVAPDVMASIHAGLAMSLARVGRHDEALAAATEARRLRTGLLGPDNPLTLELGFQLASALVGLNRVDEAVDILRDLLERFRARFGPGHSQTFIAAHELGVNLGRLDRFAEAVAPLQAAVDAKIAAFGTASGNTMNSMAQLALVQVRGGDAMSAQATIAAIDAGGYVARNEYDRRSEANLRRIRGELELALGHPAQARAACAQALDAVSQQFPEGHIARLQAQACVAVAEHALDPATPPRDALAALDAQLASAGPAAGYWRRAIARALAARK